jgi:hypothetical protein
MERIEIINYVKYFDPQWIIDERLDAGIVIEFDSLKEQTNFNILLNDTKLLFYKFHTRNDAVVIQFNELMDEFKQKIKNTLNQFLDERMKIISLEFAKDLVRILVMKWVLKLRYML